MGPKLKSTLARVTLIGGVALVASLLSRNAPHDQTLAIRLGSHHVRHIDAVVTRLGDDEPSAGFSQDFPNGSPRMLRHTFSAPTGTYIVVIGLREEAEEEGADGAAGAGESAGDVSPTLTETSFERRVSLAGGEVIVSPD